MWTATSTTNYYPAITNVPLYYDPSPPFLTFYQSPIGSYTNSTRTWTNIYWTDIQANTPTNLLYGEEEVTFDIFLGWVTNVTSGYNSTNTATNVQSWVTGGVTNTVTLELLAITAPTNIAWNMDVQWIWGFDGHQALQERWQVLNPTNDLQADTPSTLKPTLYKDNRANLVNFKSWVKSNLSNFVDPNEATNSINTKTRWRWVDGTDDVTNTLPNLWVPYLPDSFPPVSITSLVANITGFPYDIVETVSTGNVWGWEAGIYTQLVVSGWVSTNITYENTWFDYTPYHKDLGGWTDGLSNTVSGTHEFPLEIGTLASNRNQTTDSCGNVFLYDRIGTTSNMFFELFDATTNSLYSVTVTTNTVYTNAFTCTNDYIASGFNEGDYGYSVFPQVVSQFVWLASTASWDMEPNYTNELNSYVASSVDGPFGSWTNAKAEAQNDGGTNYSQNGRPRKWTAGIKSAVFANSYDAEAGIRWGQLKTDILSTNFENDVDIYLSANMEQSFSWVGGVFSDLDGIGLIDSNRFKKITTVSANSKQVVTNEYGDQSLVLSWIAEPTTNGVIIDIDGEDFGLSLEGYEVSGEKALIKWNASTNGFSY